MASNWLKTVTPCSKFCINISHFDESETLKTVMSEFLFCEGFSPGHVIITTIIKRKNIGLPDHVDSGTLLNTPFNLLRMFTNQQLQA